MRAHGRAVVEVHGAHAHHTIMEQMRLQDAPTVHADAVAEPDEVGLGQPVGLAPDPAPDPGAEAPEPQGQRRRARSAALANHGAATISTKVSTTSLRQTKRAPQRVVALADPTDDDPLRHGRERAPPRARRPASRRPRARRPTTGRSGPTSTASRASTPTAMATEQATGTNRHSSTAARAARRRRDGAKVRLLVSGHDGPAQLHRGAAEPRRPRLRLLRGGRQHRHEAVLRAPTVPGGHAGVAEERPLADLGRGDPHPAAAELVAGDHRVVGEERAVADRGHLRQQQHRRGLDALADLGPEQPAASTGSTRLA